KQPRHQLGQLVGANAEFGGDRVGNRSRQSSTHLDLVEVATDAGDLVGGQVVIDVGDVDQERLVAQKAQRLGGPHRVQDQAADLVAMLGDRPARQLQDVRRVVAHQVVQAAVVLAALLVVKALELIKKHPRLIAVADAQLEHVQLIGQGAPGS